MEVEGKSAHDIFGSPDDLKFRSILTLFARRRAARTAVPQSAEKIFRRRSRRIAPAEASLNSSAAHRGATSSIRQLSPPASGATSGGRWRSEVFAEQTRAASEGGSKIKRQMACKPGSVLACASGDHSSGMGVTAHLTRPTRTAMRKTSRAVPIWSCSRWGLPCRLCCQRRGALLPHHFNLAGPLGSLGGVISVALSLGSPPPDVIRHRLSVEPGLSSNLLRDPRSPGHLTARVIRRRFFNKPSQQARRIHHPTGHRAFRAGNGAGRR